jgi:hypothetical protein
MNKLSLSTKNCVFSQTGFCKERRKFSPQQHIWVFISSLFFSSCNERIWALRRESSYCAKELCCCSGRLGELMEFWIIIRALTDGVLQKESQE